MKRKDNKNEKKKKWKKTYYFLNLFKTTEYPQFWIRSFQASFLFRLYTPPGDLVAKSSVIIDCQQPKKTKTKKTSTNRINFVVFSCTVMIIKCNLFVT